MKIQSPLLILDEEYKDSLKEFTEFTRDRDDLKCKTKADAVSLLQDYSPEGDWENLSWEAGYLSGISGAKHAIDEWTTTLISELKKIDDGIECDNFTKENILDLINRIRKPS